MKKSTFWYGMWLIQMVGCVAAGAALGGLGHWTSLGMMLVGMVWTWWAIETWTRYQDARGNDGT